MAALLANGPLFGTDGTRSVTVTSGNNKYSNAIECKGDVVAGHLTWTVSGSGTATVKVFVSDKPNPDLASDTDWEEETTLILTAPTAADTEFFNWPGFGHRWMRIKYTYASGTSVTISGYYTVKG
jgi:hypothetical protein